MSDLDNPDQNLADAAPEEEPLLDINGNPIPRNWNPGQPPPPADAPAPGSAPRSPSAARPPGASPDPRPVAGPRPLPGPRPIPPPRPASPPLPPASASPYGGAMEEEEVKYDLAGNPLPSNRPTGQTPGLGGAYAPPQPGYGVPISGGPPRTGAGGGYGGFGRGYTTPVNGGLILGLGIAGLFCGICAPIAWVMGNSAVGAIDRGEADPAQRGTANAGRIIGMVFTILIILGLVADLIVALAFPALFRQRMQQRQQFGYPAGRYGSPYGSGGTYQPYGSTPHHVHPGFGKPLPHRTDPFSH